MTMTLWIERWYPWLAALVVGFASYKYRLPFPPDEKEFLSAAISLGAILTGFVATALAILAALPSDSVMGRIRSSGYIHELVVYLAEALYGCLTFSVVAMAGFFFLQPSGLLPTAYVVGFSSLAVFAATTFQRVSAVLFKILRFQPPHELD